MADRYHDRPFPAADSYDRGDDQHASAPAESDPLAELARLIGQTDPFGTMGRANHKVQPRTNTPEPYQPPAETYDDPPAAGPPPWMQRANRQEPPRPRQEPPRQEPPRQEPPRQDYDEPDYQPSPVHPLHRYAAQHAAPEQNYRYQEPPFAEAEEEPDPSRYDDALYGQIETGEQDYQRDPAYPDDPYADQDGYDEEEDRGGRRRGGMITIIAVLALAVIGTGAAFAYRTYAGSQRSGEPPIIKADNSPTKIVPTPSDGTVKVTDRMATGDGTEKIVPREEAPVDLNAKSGGPRVVFPPLNQNSNPPSPASVAPSNIPAPTPAPNNGTLPNSEPRKIRTLSVRGDSTDPAPQGSAPQGSAPQGSAPQGSAAAKPAAAPKAAAASTAPRNPSNANASTANAPLSLSPQGADPAPAAPAAPADTRTRVAATGPVQPAPNGGAAVTSGGGYLVQVSSQRSESDAQASFRALQSKFPGVLGSQSPVIKRADLGDKGIYYRAMVGPFGTPEEASQLCGNLKTAGGQCVVQRN